LKVCDGYVAFIHGTESSLYVGCPDGTVKIVKDRAISSSIRFHRDGITQIIAFEDSVFTSSFDKLAAKFQPDLTFDSLYVAPKLDILSAEILESKVYGLGEDFLLSWDSVTGKFLQKDSTPKVLYKTNLVVYAVEDDPRTLSQFTYPSFTKGQITFCNV
jgi:hypothetical protein